MIASIVEGHGDVAAVPALIRHVATHVAPGVAIQVLRPHRRPRSSLVRSGELERCGRIALSGSAGAHLLVLVDADDDCPAEFGPELLARVEDLQPRQVEVVLAKREFENWFLASAESLAGRRGLRNPLESPPDPEAVRGAKEWIQANRTDGRAYRPTVDQAALTVGLDIDLARNRSTSFDKLCRVLEGWLLGAR